MYSLEQLNDESCKKRMIPLEIDNSRIQSMVNHVFCGSKESRIRDAQEGFSYPSSSSLLDSLPRLITNPVIREPQIMEG